MGMLVGRVRNKLRKDMAEERYGFVKVKVPIMLYIKDAWRHRKSSVILAVFTIKTYCGIYPAI